MRELVSGERRDVGIGVVFLALSSVSAGAIPQCIRGASDALRASQAGRAAMFAGALAALAAVGVWFRVESRLRIFNAGRQAEFVLRERMLARLHQLGPTFFQRLGPGEVMSRATNDLAQVRMLIGFGGALVALNVTGTSFNVISLLGLVLLGGVVVGNGIVLMEYINQLRS